MKATCELASSAVQGQGEQKFLWLECGEDSISWQPGPARVSVPEYQQIPIEYTCALRTRGSTTSNRLGRLSPAHGRAVTWRSPSAEGLSASRSSIDQRNGAAVSAMNPP